MLRTSVLLGCDCFYTQGCFPRTLSYSPDHVPGSHQPRIRRCHSVRGMFACEAFEREAMSSKLVLLHCCCAGLSTLLISTPVRRGRRAVETTGSLEHKAMLRQQMEDQVCCVQYRVRVFLLSSKHVDLSLCALTHASSRWPRSAAVWRRSARRTARTSFASIASLPQ
jgi:hypothetical protein